MSSFQRTVPVLQVKDVDRSMRWYASALGFRGDPFPEQPPYSFAILEKDDVEIMLQCGKPRVVQGEKGHREGGWAVYLRNSGGDLLQLAAVVACTTPLIRGPERMFYGLVEFEILDPDGHRICLSGQVPAGADVPQATEREDWAREAT